MPRFRCGHAAHPRWRQAALSCLAQLGPEPLGGGLGFLYCSDLLAEDLHEILEFLRSRTGVSHWIGTVGIGICAAGREYLDEPALAVLVGEFGDGEFQVFRGPSRPAELGSAPLSCGGARPNFAVVHGDPAEPEIAAFVAALAERMESGFLAGGLTSSRGSRWQIADELVEGGISGALFSPDVAISVRLTQGCTPLGRTHVVTQCQRNIIAALDFRPALDVFEEDIGEMLARDLDRAAGYIFAGLPVPGGDSGDYMVRNVTGVDPVHRLIAIGDEARPGMPVLFCRRDGKSARDDMARMLDGIKDGLFAPPRGGVYYSCLGRGESLFGRNSELRMIEEALGSFPLVGFFGNGEISHNRLYGYAGVLTLFP